MRCVEPSMGSFLTTPCGQWFQNERCIMRRPKLLKGLTVQDERDFERRHIGAQRTRYLETDVLDRARWDDGYAEKLNLIERSLSRASLDSWILDLGANTCGEAEFFAAKGRKVIAMDINEVALGISRTRAAGFRRELPRYVAGDAHQIPLNDESVDFCLCFEVLHHMERPAEVTKEIHRVLRPGGTVFMLEPYALNPYRRMAEVRERMKGTIEKSFTKHALSRLIRGSNLKIATEGRVVLRPSKWKELRLGKRKKALRRAYFEVASRLPQVFGSLAIEACKGGEPSKSKPAPFQSLLRCPISHAGLVWTDSGELISQDRQTRLKYAISDGIPVLIAAEAKQVSLEDWSKLISSAK